MKKDIYFGTYKNSNVNKLNNYIKLIDEINSKYYNFSFPFTKGNFDLNYQDYIKDKKMDFLSPLELHFYCINKIIFNIVIFTILCSIFF